MSNNEEKKCWKCNRIIVGESHLGLCENCYNAYGSWGSVAMAAVGVFALKKLGPTVAKKAPEVIKRVIKL